MFKSFIPDFHFESVSEITSDFLNQQNIRNLLLDADGTLKRYRETEAAPNIRAWLEQCRAEGIGLCILSNGLSGRISHFAKQLEIPFFAPALKPSSRGCLRAMAEMQFQKENTAIIGDQIFADIWAGRRAKIRTIHVTPNHPEDEPFFTRFKRPFETFVLRSSNFPH